MTAFSVKIAHQGWLPGSTSEDDLCSHGGIRLVVGGVEVTTGEEEYGVSESALAMLRTLQSERIRGDALVESMIFHGCGAMLASGCGLGVDWTTRHYDGTVSLSDVVRFDAAGSRAAREFPDAQVTIPFEAYAAEVTAFAREARRMFEATPKRYAANELFPGEYAAFWAEYDALLQRFSSGRLIPLAI